MLSSGGRSIKFKTPQFRCCANSAAATPARGIKTLIKAVLKKLMNRLTNQRCALEAINCRRGIISSSTANSRNTERKTVSRSADSESVTKLFIQPPLSKLSHYLPQAIILNVKDNSLKLISKYWHRRSLFLIQFLSSIGGYVFAARFKLLTISDSCSSSQLRNRQEVVAEHISIVPAQLSLRK